MSLDLSKLQNVKTAAGKTTARCPACAAAGGDAKGDHLVIYPDGGYGCVANPKDKAHTKEIFRHAGMSGGQGSTSKISVRAVDVPKSSVLMDLKGFDRFKVTPIPRPQTTAASASKETTAADGKPPATELVDADESPLRADKDAAVQENEPPLTGDWVDLDGTPSNGTLSQRSSVGQPLWEFLGVTEEVFHSAGVEPVATKDVC